MIRGLGSDVVRISRIENAIQRHGERFVARLLTADEQQVWARRGLASRFIACRWAAKEAAAKALGTGIGRGVGFHQFHISNNEYGAPQLHLTGEAAQQLSRLGASEAQLSISDDGDYAFAVVILQ